LLGASTVFQPGSPPLTQRAGLLKAIYRFTGSGALPSLRYCRICERYPAAEKPGSGILAICKTNSRLRASTMAAAAVAAAIVRRPFAYEPMTSRRRVRISRAIIGTGRIRLSATWLRISAWVASIPSATTTKEVPS
jgi:hypothetical protein